jgi:hypothetical protein
VTVFHRPLKISVVVLVTAGVAMAITGAIAALLHQQAVNAAVFVAIAVILAAVAILIVREVRWVIAVCFVVLAGQLGAIVGTMWESDPRRRRGQGAAVTRAGLRSDNRGRHQPHLLQHRVRTVLLAGMALVVPATPLAPN